MMIALRSTAVTRASSHDNKVYKLLKETQTKKQILPYSYFSLCSIYPLMFIALCHIPTKRSS